MEYTVEMRMRLDISALPKPFQVETLGSREWDLSTGMIRWSTKLPPPKESPKSAVESGTHKIGVDKPYTPKVSAPALSMLATPGIAAP
jgi:hypothetical protein